ncbi:unnamed protein product [Soboliphyme baturini]|uniref:E3 ubiquitin protein ligase n=1 Tax=Soboliphyme baturini TaxID=241478 RepID=A0A183J8F1_9BILA|nr:unnamed protein product [Soboliphyme baturini]
MEEFVSTLQMKNRSCDLKRAKAVDQFAAMNTQIEEWKSRVEDLEYEVEKSHMREEQLDYRLAEVVNQLQVAQNATVNSNADKSESSSVSCDRFEELQANLQEQSALAQSRLEELQDINERYKEALTAIETLKSQCADLNQFL